MEDLWCFNDELLVWEIVCFGILIVSVVGYEVDVIIVDFVVDLCVLILFVVVELVFMDQMEFLLQICNLMCRLF